MRVLVCGGAGFIGRPLTQALVNAGHDVYATVYTRDPRPRVEGVKYIEADLTARGCWNLALGREHGTPAPEAVFMCAGKTGGSGLDPLHFVTDNALIALQMFRSCAEFGVNRIIAMSSTTGYPDSSLPMREEDYFTGDIHPAYFNPGHTRRFIERLAAMYPQIETVFVRCAGAYGPGDDFDPQSSHVIAASVRKVAERQDPITIWGDGNNQRDGTYISDLVDALVKCLDAPAGAYNIGSGELWSINAIVGMLLITAQHEPTIIHDESRPQMIRTRRLNTEKALRMLGWMPKVSMVDGLVKTLEWYARR